MNKNRYRLVFNQVRRIMMAVAENVSAGITNTQNTTSTAVDAPIYAGIQPIKLALMLLLGSAMVISNTAQADIIADGAAPGNQQPMITNTANGLPLVNIQTPSAAGVSRNLYSQFDVDAQGAILNNSNTNVQTQLGGWVQGNPYLAGGTARVILNEVNSSNPSLLNGFIEIAGSRAQLVIANPAGISCDGCGFINANRATLTTGTPIINGGNLLGYRVGGGGISFLGQGMDASNANYTDVIARAVEVNSGIWANELNITTGTNEVRIDSNGNQTSVTATTPSTTATHAFAIDVAALGGMYAGKIHMIGTEAGLGVRNASTLGASVGEFTVSVDGELINTGSMGGVTQTAIAATNITNQGDILSGGDITINAQSLDNLAEAEITGANATIDLTGTLTNRGLIDGSDTFITADSIHNLGTGAIFGDYLALATTTLTNESETISGITKAGVLAARTQLDIGADTIINQDGALIFSSGDMAIGAALDTNHVATGQATSLLNSSASIEALGNLAVNIADLTNQRREFSTERVLVGSSTTTAQICVDVGNCSYINHMTYQQTDYEDIVTADSPSAYILSGGSALFNVVSLTNLYSHIEIGGDLTLTGNSLLNQGAEFFHQTDLITTANLIHWGDRDHGTTVEYDSSSTLIGSAPAVISAGGTLLGSFTDRIDNVTIRENTSRVITGETPSLNTGGSNLANNSLFTTVTDPAAGYLVETDPRFASYRNWLSSDYMMNQLAFDPAITQKRLGDGFYEQKLIREQIAQLTGRRFLDGYANDEAQYQALMSNGLTQASAMQLVPGVALSAEQVAQLTSDIVWLVEQDVTLPDSTVTKALVPQVYVRLQSDDLSPSGAVLAGSNVGLGVVNGDLTTSGTVAGRNIVSITASNINNVRGLISGNDVYVDAVNDINVEGGSIAGKDSLIATAGNDINVKSSTVDLTDRMRGETSATVSSHRIDRVAGLYVSNPDAILVASAGNDINLLAAAIQNSGANTNGTGGTLIQAGNDVNIGAVTETGQSFGQSKNSWRKETSSTDVGSVIQTTGDIYLNANNNLTATAASISSQSGNLIATAGKDITITAGTNTSESDAYRKIKTTSRKKEYWDTTDETTRVGSTLSANNVILQAGTSATGNLAIESSNVVSTNGTALSATGDISIISLANTLTESHTSKQKKSGFSASGSSIGYGTSKLSQKQNGTTVTQTGSTVGSTDGDVIIQAGNTYTQTGSDVLAPQGDIDITAKKVDITAAYNTSLQKTETEYKQSGLTLAITSPVINAIQTIDQMKQASSQTTDGRMQALAAGTAALSAKNAYDGTMSALNAPTSTESMVNAGNQAGGVNLSLSIGTSKSSSTTTQTSSTAQSSHVSASGDISIKATGAGQDSDINIIGSKISAGNDLSLKADDQINLVAAQNVDTLKSKNSGSSASVGVSVGSDGLLLNVGASGSKGKANGSDVTWTESIAQAGNNVTLESGTDTNLIGSQVNGEQVVANIGTTGQGDLNIQSLQDTSTYNDKQQSIGGTVSVGYGKWSASANFSNSKTNSDYASVNEQAGIYAGDGGFQLNVNGNTDLKGAVIASSQTAIDQQRNSLTTETITISDIKNKAEYDASSMSIGGGYGGNIGKNQQGQATTGGSQVPGTKLASLNGFSATAPVALSASGEDSSTTKSAISGGAIDITNESKQQELTGKDAATTVALLNRDVVVDENGNAVDSQGNSTAGHLTPIFDEETKQNINAGFEIVKAFSNETSTFLTNRARESTEAQKVIESELAKDQPNREVLEKAYKTLEDNQMWEMGGSGRIALTAITGAFSGNITGTTGDLVQSATILTLQSLGAKEIKALADSLGGEGSAEHTALHALLACGGAAATGGDCGTAALASSSGVILNKLFDSIEGKDADSLTPDEREARAKLINTIVTGTTALLGGDTVTAQIAAQIETENNGLVDYVEKALDNYDKIKEGVKKVNDMRKLADMSIKGGVIQLNNDQIVLDEQQTKDVLTKFFPNDGLPDVITSEDKAFAQYLVLQALQSSYSLAIIQGVGEAVAKNPAASGFDILKNIAFSSNNKTYEVDGEKKIYMVIQNTLTRNMRSEYVGRLNGDSYTVVNIKN